MESLIPLLKSVSVLSNNKERDTFQLMLYEAEDNPEKADPNLLALFKEVKKYPELSVFDNHMQVVGNSALPLDYGYLIHWLITRTSVVGAELSIQNLKRYLSTSEIPFLEVTAVAGFNTSKACDLENGIKLTPWDEFQDSYQKEYISKQFATGAPFHFPGSVLYKERKIARTHISRNEANPHFEKDLFSELHDALLCICIVGPVSPYAIASWLQPPDWAIIRGYEYSLPFIEGRASHREWPADGCDQAQKTHKAFIKLCNKQKAALRLSMERLNLAMRRHSHVDAAIDLGIALESIFLNDLGSERGELTYRLKLRASKYLGRTLDEKKKLFKTFGDLYLARSTAVHTGKPPDNLKKTSINDLLNNGFNLTASAIKRIILDGQPDWLSITLD